MAVGDPYGTQDQLDDYLGGTLVDTLADIQGTGASNVTAVYDGARNEADRHIDRALAQAYSVPFDPDIVTEILPISHALTTAYLFRKRHAGGDDWKVYWDQAIFALDRLAKGQDELPNGTKAAADAGRVGLSYSTAPQDFVGYDDTDADKPDRMEDW